MNRALNQHTQPFRTHPVFNNWDVVAKGWYIALRSKALGKMQATSVTVCGQRLVLFRGEDGKARALDAFCPHMGTNLGLGKVVGNTLRCYFHHWRYDESGACVDIPCGEPIPARARLHRWATEERYGFIWVYPDAVAPAPVPEPPELEGQTIDAVPGPAFTRPCHHHVNMINGIDPQHLSTVHGIRIDMQLEAKEDEAKGLYDFVLRGETPSKTVKERIVRALLGPVYAYGMRYSRGTIGVLTLAKDVRLFGTGPLLPEIYMLYAYRPIEPGKTEVQPIYLARRRRGPFGWLFSRALMWAMRIAYAVLRDEDGAIYDDIRFDPKNLLKMDAPVARYIAWVNRQTPSLWSKALVDDTERREAGEPPPRRSLNLVEDEPSLSVGDRVAAQ